MENTANPTIETVVGSTVIKVIGVGGGGCNAINHMIENPIQGVEYISANTDAQSLQGNLAKNKIQLGNPEVGRDAALEDREAIAKLISGADMLFITTGMGGGTGTGATPVIAEVAKELGILTVAVVTRPFKHEGRRTAIAQEGIDNLKRHVDSLIVVPNDKLLAALGKGVTVRAAFRAANNVLRNAVAGISEIVTYRGLINVDFADVKNMMSITGMAMMGIGEASGPDRARIAVQEAISSPLLDDINLNGAKGVLVNITTAPECFILDEYEEIMAKVTEYALPDAELKFGNVEDENMDEDAIRITIIATGLEDQNQPRPAAPVRSTPRHDALGGDGAGMIISGRKTRSMNLVAADFSSQSVLDDFEVPAVVRRQGLNNNNGGNN